MIEVDLRRPYRSEISAALLSLAVFCSALLFWRAVHGEIRQPVSLRSPMNLEGICALALLAAAALRSGYSKPVPDSNPPSWPAVTALTTIIVLAFAPFLNFPFLADDYDHIWNARHLTLSSALAHFTHPEPDRFFRPLVYLFYGFEARFAGLNPATWRAVSVAWHLTATVLLWSLLRKLTPSRFAAFAGAALFAVHGSRPEAVTWVAARFDLMATAFGLAALNLLLRKRDLAAALFLLLALLSKESAFAFPFLAFLILRGQKETWRECFRRTAAWFAIAAATFLYRLSVLGEIGGYHNASDGRPTIFNLKLTTTLKGLFVRSSAAVIFPVNWTSLPGLSLSILMSAGVLGLVFLAWRGGERRLLLVGLAFFCLAALPVHQFLSIGDDLEKSRVLYLPLAGVAIVFAGLLSVSASRASMMACAAFLIFQFAALEHNLKIWKSVGLLAASTCSQITREIDRSPGPIAVPGLPNVIDGVYFLKTGYPACVWLQRPEKQDQATNVAKPGAAQYRWDEHSRRVVPDAERLSLR